MSHKRAITFPLYPDLLTLIFEYFTPLELKELLKNRNESSILLTAIYTVLQKQTFQPFYSQYPVDELALFLQGDELYCFTLYKQHQKYYVSKLEGYLDGRVTNVDSILPILNMIIFFDSHAAQRLFKRAIYRKKPNPIYEFILVRDPNVINYKKFDWMYDEKVLRQVIELGINLDIVNSEETPFTTLLKDYPHSTPLIKYFLQIKSGLTLPDRNSILDFAYSQERWEVIKIF